jgi:hypothetical protein
MSRGKFRGGILPAEAQRRRKQATKTRKVAQLAKAAELAKEAGLAVAAQHTEDAQLAMVERIASTPSPQSHAEHAESWTTHMDHGQPEEISR